MKLWLPYVRSGSGSDVYTARLAEGLRRLGWQVVVTPFPRQFELVPWALKPFRKPDGIDAIVANSWNAFAFGHEREVPLIAVEHHCVFDPDYEAYKGRLQKVYHRFLIRRFEELSFSLADAVVAVSKYTAAAVSRAFGVSNVRVILNGIDARLWAPDTNARRSSGAPYKLLFVGNLSERKGADLLPRIMRELGRDYQLTCVLGLRGKQGTRYSEANIRAVSGLTVGELRALYSSSNLLLFPSRLEGFGYAIAEAMACETPVVATDVSAIPELVDGATGILCKRDDVDCFVSAVRTLCERPGIVQEMGRRCRQRVLRQFTEEEMARGYDLVLREVISAQEYRSDRSQQIG